MTSDQVLGIGYFVDLGIKAVIGILVALIGMDYRETKSSLQDLERAKYQLQIDISVVKTEAQSIKDRLASIERKLDKALEK